MGNSNPEDENEDDIVELELDSEIVDTELLDTDSLDIELVDSADEAQVQLADPTAFAGAAPDQPLQAGPPLQAQAIQPAEASSWKMFLPTAIGSTVLIVLSWLALSKSQTQPPKSDNSLNPITDVDEKWRSIVDRLDKPPE